MSDHSVPLRLKPPALIQRQRLNIKTPRTELVVLLFAVGLLNFWALDGNGVGNEYYAAAVRSMDSSWHAFFYLYFDHVGVMTIDKPPLFLWIQAASAKLFGFNSWALLGPQALMSVGSVWFVYDLTRRRFGRVSGLLAGAVLGLTPICVAISRHNNPDALLILCCTAAVWLVVRGLEDGRWRWLMLAAVAIGLGFETKMAAALLVVPALAAAWFWIAPRGRLLATGQLMVAGAIMTVVGLAWPVAVWLTPAKSRPWISGTDDNSIWSLMFGYNGMGRVAGQAGWVRGSVQKDVFAGYRSPFRLINESLGTQIGWFLGLAVVVGLTLLVMTRLRRNNPHTGWLLAVGGSALTVAFIFTVAGGIFHPYYVSFLGPFVACLVGAAFFVFDAKRRKLRLVGAIAIVAGFMTEMKILHDSALLNWFVPILALVGLTLSVMLIFARSGHVRKAVIGTALVVLLLVPAYWSVLTTGNPGDGTFPYGGPSLATLPAQPPVVPEVGRPNWFALTDDGMVAQEPSKSFIGPQPRPRILGVDLTKMEEKFRRHGAPYLKLLPVSLELAQRYGGGTVIVSGQSGDTAQAVINGENIAAIGGFSGRESEVTLPWLADMIARKRARWFVTASVPRRQRYDDRMGAMRVMGAVTRYCTLASAEIGLYDCRHSAARLRAANLDEIPPLTPKNLDYFSMMTMNQLLGKRSPRS